MPSHPETTEEDPVARFRRLIRVEPRGHTSPGIQPTEAIIPAIPGQAPRPPQTRTLVKAAAIRRWLGLLTGRASMVILTCLAVLWLTFFGLGMASGQPFDAAAASAIERTGAYVLRLSHGDLGETGEYGFSRLPRPVLEILPEIVGRSFALLFGALALAALLGLPLGLWSARGRRALWSLPIVLLSSIGMSLPSFFVALLLQMLVIRLTQATGRTVLPVGGMGWDAHLVLPILVLAARPLAQIARVANVCFAEILDQEYIRTAHSKGLTPAWILGKHVMRNAAVPVLTTIGVALRYSLISLPVVEYFFGWQGLGFYLLKAIATNEADFAAGMLLCLVAAFLLVNLLLEASYGLCDPRLRGQGSADVRRARGRIGDALREIPEAIWGIVRRSRLGHLIARGRDEDGLPPLAELAKGMRLEELDETRRMPRRLWARATLGNPGLMLGGLLVLGLIFLVLFGASLTPHSPYTTRGLVLGNGEFSVPPFPPSETYPLGTDLLGRDLMSLIMAGARQTMLLAALSVLGRLVLGTALGALAGWWSGSWIDRLALALVEVLAAFPALLLAMVLILAFNIRNGMPPFILALSLVGWGEIIQFVRAEVMRLRPAEFVESAAAVGTSSIEIITRHIWPNLLPSLVSITTIEMGAALMLLGELGFVGIFIGGGIFAELEWMAPLFHYSDVPEWGSLLSNVRTYARGYPWMGLYPGLAFFGAILAFNLFGEGIRKLIDQVGVHVMRILNRYTLALAAGLVAAIFWIQGSTGSIVAYQQNARTFEGKAAKVDIEALTAPAAEGRNLGTLGLQVAAEWIAESFERLGLQPAGETFTYFQPRRRDFQVLAAQPVLQLNDGGEPLRFQEDFNVYPSRNTIAGHAAAPFRFLGLGRVRSYTQLGYRYYDLEDLDFRDQILLVFEEDMFYLDQIPHGGALVIAASPEVLQQHYALSPFPAGGREAPALWVSEVVANRLLEPAGKTVRELRQAFLELGEEERLEIDLGVEAVIDIQGVNHENVPTMNVIGHLQGVVSNEYEGMDQELFVVLAKYDCPPAPLGQQSLPCASDNASGVAVMLEAIRALQETGYQPYRTFLFVAYSGEGWEGGGQVSAEDVGQFLVSKHGFDRFYDLKGVIEVRAVGSGGSDLEVKSFGSLRLAQLFERAAARQGVSVSLVRESMDVGRLFRDGSGLESGEQVPRIIISRAGWETISATREDTPDRIDEKQLEEAGRVFALSLMILGRELDY